MSERPSRIRRASTWWVAGICLHALWMLALVLWIAIPALEPPVAAWVERYKYSTEELPVNLAVYGYVLDAFFGIILLAFLPWLIAAVLTWRDMRIDRRRRRGQCEKCAYPIGVSPVCTECGAAVRPLAARSS